MVASIQEDLVENRTRKRIFILFIFRSLYFSLEIHKNENEKKNRGVGGQRESEDDSVAEFLKHFSQGRWKTRNRRNGEDGGGSTPLWKDRKKTAHEQQTTFCSALKESWSREGSKVYKENYDQSAREAETPKLTADYSFWTGK